MDSSSFIAIITALATLIGAISPMIVIWLQSNKENQRSNNGILLPADVVLHRPRKPMGWLTISFYALLGGVLGYVGATILNVNSFDKTSTPTMSFPSISDTPQPISTRDIPGVLSSASEAPFTNTPIQSPTKASSLLIPQSTLPPPLITVPRDGASVTWDIDVFVSVVPSALDQGTHLNIIVFADGSFPYYVQAIPEIQPDGTWRSSPVHIGTAGSADTGKAYRICAVLHIQQLPPGEIPSFPTGSKSCIKVIRE